MLDNGPALSPWPGRRENFPAPDVEHFCESEPLRLRDERENWLQLGDLVIEGLGRLSGDVSYRPLRAQDLDEAPPAPQPEPVATRDDRGADTARRGRVTLGSRVDPNLAPTARTWSRPVVRQRRGSLDE